MPNLEVSPRSSARAIYRTGDRGLTLVRHFEGFSATAYRCPAGYWTIGYGHRLDIALHAPQRSSHNANPVPASSLVIPRHGWRRSEEGGDEAVSIENPQTLTSLHPKVVFFQESKEHSNAEPFRQLHLTEAEATALLAQDLNAAERAVRRLIPVALTQSQFDALVSFTYNLGSGTLQRSTLRQKSLRNEHHSAAQEFNRYIYAAGRKLPGLVTRRAAEAALYLS